jgi:hypothetical protein
MRIFLAMFGVACGGQFSRGAPWQAIFMEKCNWSRTTFFGDFSLSS